MSEKIVSEQNIITIKKFRVWLEQKAKKYFKSMIEDYGEDWVYYDIDDATTDFYEFLQDELTVNDIKLESEST